MVNESIMEKLTAKDDKYACALSYKIISESKNFLTHITDENPITARQCVKALAQVGLAKPQYIPRILSALQEADLSKYKDSMRPLIERDIEETEMILKD